MDVVLERILPRVQKPGRYTGGEYNSIIKERKNGDIGFAFCFPDTYEIGMSNLGMQILYGVINEMEGFYCERVFAPWPDMEAEMRKASLPLWGLETRQSVRDFDLVGFSLSYELSYTNVLNMLDLAGIPPLASERETLKGIVIAGGTCAYNPEPLADFIDIFSIGEGEEALPELLIAYRKAKQEGLSKAEFLKRASTIEGMYVPSLYDVRYFEDGTISSITALSPAPAVVQKRIVQDLNKSYFPQKPIVPSTEIVHDRANVELFRGCIRACRFCQAGYTYRPVRAKSPEVVLGQAEASILSTGWQELGLSSLSTSDYTALGPLCDDLLDFCVPRSTSLSLPSLRTDNFSLELMQKVQRVRKSGLTFAPEAGTQRLRDVINKNVTEEDLMNTLRITFKGGWSSVKLYFMIGLPTETDEDVLAIAELAQKALAVWKECATNRGRGARISVSVSCFIPKPCTPFQWEPLCSMEELERKQQLLRGAMRSRAVSFSWHDAATSRLEAVFARGDRRLGRVLLEAWRHGAKFDGWNEYFNYENWLLSFERCCIDPDFYTARQRSKDEILPWSSVSCGVREQYLWQERQSAYRGQITPDCRKECTGCGASSMLDGRNCDEPA